MTIEVSKDRTVKWNFYRKAYKKARWRRLGERCIKDFFRFIDEHPGSTGGLIVII